MILRVWRTRIDESRADDYREFARGRSVPMFRSQPGFVGGLFGARHGERAVITIWEDRTAAEVLSSSESYQITVAAIEASGFLIGESSVEMFELEGAVLDAGLGSLRHRIGLAEESST
jgi:heme-degrading monooxygenase HmoA